MDSVYVSEEIKQCMNLCENERYVFMCAKGCMEFCANKKYRRKQEGKNDFESDGNY